MASAKTIDFDYDISDGALEMVGGIPEALSAQLFELVTNVGEWFLGTDFGYPWIVKNSSGDNVGILGTSLDKEFVATIISEKIQQNSTVQTIESIQLSTDAGMLRGEIRERLYVDNGLLSPEARTEFLRFSFGGDQ